MEGNFISKQLCFCAWAQKFAWSFFFVSMKPVCLGIHGHSATKTIALAEMIFTAKHLGCHTTVIFSGCNRQTNNTASQEDTTKELDLTHREGWKISNDFLHA